MNSVKKVVIANVVSLVVLVGGGLAGFHYYDEATNYINTDNAKINGQQIVVSSPVAGKLSNWKVNDTEQFSKNSSIGKVQVSAPTPENPAAVAQVDIKAPADLTVVSNKGLENSFVATGTPLVYGYNMDQLYVVANIKETLVKDVNVGQDVDIFVDAFKNTKFTGKVEEVGLATASTFSLLPESNGNANYTKVTQVVPIKISIDDTKGNRILPGMNVSVRIHK